jgi:hypothetical protein
MSAKGDYQNLGIKTESGFIIPIRPVVKKHYYSLVAQATQVTVDYKKKGE